MKEKLKSLEIWYLTNLLEDCEYAIENEEDFADGGPDPQTIRKMIEEILEWRELFYTRGNIK